MEWTIERKLEEINKTQEQILPWIYFSKNWSKKNALLFEDHELACANGIENAEILNRLAHKKRQMEH